MPFFRTSSRSRSISAKRYGGNWLEPVGAGNERHASIYGRTRRPVKASGPGARRLWRRAFLFGLGDEAVGGEDHSGDRSGVLQGHANHLHRVHDSGGSKSS